MTREVLIGLLGVLLFIAMIVIAEIKLGKLKRSQIIKGASTTIAMLICIFLFVAGHPIIEKYALKLFPKKENLRAVVEMIGIALIGFGTQRLLERFIVRKQKS